MSTRLTHHRRSLTDRWNAYIEARANAVMMAYGQRAQDDLSAATHAHRQQMADLTFRHRVELENTRREYVAANESTQRELDIEIELSRRLGHIAGIDFAGLCALRVQVQDDFHAQDVVADAEDVLRRAFPDPSAFLAHPSNGGES